MAVSSTYAGVDQRITVRWRIVPAGVRSHRIIPMRWPISGRWPEDGEEDYCEGGGLSGCSTFLHYPNSSPAGGQVGKSHSVDLSQWHVMRFERRDFVVKVYVDDLQAPVWTYAGNATTLPATVKRAVLQQECPSGGCPSGDSGTEDIQIDWITIDDPG